MYIIWLILELLYMSPEDVCKDAGPFSRVPWYNCFLFTHNENNKDDYYIAIMVIFIPPNLSQYN